MSERIDLESMRNTHTAMSVGGKKLCGQCLEPWPCHTVALVAELEQTRKDVAAAEERAKQVDGKLATIDQTLQVAGFGGYIDGRPTQDVTEDVQATVNWIVELQDAIREHLPFHEDDVAEGAMYLEAVERAKTDLTAAEERSDREANMRHRYESEVAATLEREQVLTIALVNARDRLNATVEQFGTGYRCRLCQAHAERTQDIKHEPWCNTLEIRAALGLPMPSDTPASQVALAPAQAVAVAQLDRANQLEKELAEAQASYRLAVERYDRDAATPAERELIEAAMGWSERHPKDLHRDPMQQSELTLSVAAEAVRQERGKGADTLAEH